jgi:hypothetical protein
VNIIELLIYGVLLIGALRACIFAIREGKRRNWLRAVGNLAGGIALVGGVVGLAAQSLIFDQSGFSKTSGEVFIPILRDGVYTTRHLAIAWYSGVAMLLGGVLVAAIVSALVKATQQKR